MHRGIENKLVCEKLGSANQSNVLEIQLEIGAYLDETSVKQDPSADRVKHPTNYATGRGTRVVGRADTKASCDANRGGNSIDQSACVGRPGAVRVWKTERRKTGAQTETFERFCQWSLFDYGFMTSITAVLTVKDQNDEEGDKVIVNREGHPGEDAMKHNTRLRCLLAGFG